ncbi:hypothetical protein ACFVYV_51655, partial [Streptomyces mirabilis]|uniref:hypothetical protein n=1 Tax=Streptomyces mirabilis TaxID=68239 RepID=UPI0036D9EF71
VHHPARTAYHRLTAGITTRHHPRQQPEEISRDVVQLRSRFATNHNYPRLAQDLVAAYSEKMSQFTYTYTYPCAGSGAAHGTMSVWLPGFGGTLSCISKRRDGS